MLAHIARPRLAHRHEARVVACEQRAGRFLETLLVAGHGRNEPVGGFLRRAESVLLRAGLTRGVHQPPNGGRGAAGLRREPVPVAGKERHLARNDAEPRPPAATWGRTLEVGRSILTVPV